MFKNKWFWVLVLGVWDLGLVGMSVYLPYWRVREMAGWRGGVASPVVTPQPSPSPTMSPADAKGKVLGESVGGPALDNGSRQPDKCADCSALIVEPTPQPSQLMVSNVSQVAPAPTQDLMLPSVTPVSSITPTSLPSPLPSEEQAVSERTNSVVTALSAGDSGSLYALLSSELTDTFPESSLQQAFNGQSGTKYVLIGEPDVEGEWATQRVEVQLDGAVTTYTMVLHLEAGTWMLYGTMPA